MDQSAGYPLPAGYTKVKQHSEVTFYKLPVDPFSAYEDEETEQKPFVDGLLPFIGRARILVVPLLDDIINELFDFHILEPMIEYTEHTRVKAILQKPPPKLGSQDAAHIVENNKPFGVGGKPRFAKLSALSKVPLSNFLKLEVAKSDNKVLAEEVAQTVELLVSAVERDSKDIYDFRPRSIVNQAQLLQQNKALEKKMEEA